MWGMKRKEFFTQFAPNLTMLGLLKGWTCNSTKYDAYDEFFLRDEIWPRVKDSVFIHDAYTCQRTPGAVGFPCPRMYGVLHFLSGNNLLKPSLKEMENTLGKNTASAIFPR